MNTKYKTPILLIEDNPGDAELVNIYLEEAGIKYELYQCEALFEGLELIQKIPMDLVLLDLNLPDTSGFKTLSSFLERAPNTPVIVLTGTNNEIIGNQAVKAGAQDFLIKGQFDSKLLGRVVRYSLQRSKVQLKLEETARELEITKKRFLEAQEMAHFGTWEMDLVTNEMKWTDEVYRIFGFHPGSLTPTLSDYLSYVHFDDKASVESFFDAVGKDGKLHHLEHRILIDGTSIRYVTIQAMVQIEEITQKIFLVGGIQDITERKLSEKLLIEKNISSQTAKIKEEALEELGFHIRTPLSSIVNLLFLLENTQMTTQQISYLDDLKISMDDLSIAVNNLLNFSVLVADQVKVEEEEFVIQEFIQSAGKMLKLKADNAKIQLEIDIDEKVPEKVIGDPMKLTQVLYNLIDNALKFTNEGGKIIIKAQPSELQGSKLDLLLSVEDTGKGIGKAKIKELLQADKLLELPPEENPEKKRPLGIAIVARLIRTMGGEIYIKSKQGEGTTFICSVPVKIPRKNRFISGEVPDAPLKILLVEDHFLNQIATKKVLTSWSEFITVDIAENGLVAIGKFKEHGYDMILMDIQMPVMNGLDAAKKIREFSNVPIIALTANSTKQEQDKCFEIGMNDYLAKPFKPQDLYAKIMSIMSLVLN
jgi:CheY-like chemotaxis protein